MSKKVMAVVAVVALVAILGICLVACNAESYEKKLEKAGYKVTSYTGDDAKDEAKSDADIEWFVVGVKGSISLSGIEGDIVSVAKFKNTDDAKDYESNSIKGLGEDCVYRVGKIVIVGTSKQAVKDAK